MTATTVMDDTVKLIVQFSCFAIILEIIFRSYFNNGNSPYWNMGGILFLLSYISCIIAGTLGLKDLFPFIKSNEFKSFMSYLHGLDGVSALIIGISIYFKSVIGISIGILLITKFSVICLMNRMILGKISNDTSLIDEIQQTSKSYLHHVASFLFIQHPLEILITTAWRTISMSGHSLLVLRNSPHFTEEQLTKLNWNLSHIRNIFVFILLIICSFHSEIREAFARSAVGHISYMAVRFGPVFQLGSIYVPVSDKQAWHKMSEKEKLHALLFEWKHPWLTLELSLLFVTSLFFAFLRIELLLRDTNLFGSIFSLMNPSDLLLKPIFGNMYLRSV